MEVFIAVIMTVGGIGFMLLFAFAIGALWELLTRRK
jgi:Trk-type K+ transport system membrane component